MQNPFPIGNVQLNFELKLAKGKGNVLWTNKIMWLKYIAHLLQTDSQSVVYVLLLGSFNLDLWTRELVLRLCALYILYLYTDRWEYKCIDRDLQRSTTINSIAINCRNRATMNEVGKKCLHLLYTAVQKMRLLGVSLLTDCLCVCLCGGLLLRHLSEHCGGGGVDFSAVLVVSKLQRQNLNQGSHFRIYLCLLPP